MALQIPYTDAHGTTHASAYGRINWYACRREIGQPALVDYVIEMYVSNAARLAQREPLTTLTGRMAVDDTGPVRLADLYAHAHTLPEFQGAADV